MAALAVASVLAGACAHQARAVDVLPKGAARALVVRLDDLPAGFREAPSITPDDPSGAQVRAYRACFGTDPRPQDQQGRVRQFTDPSDRTVLSAVAVTEKEAQARAVITRFSDVAKLRCAARTFIAPAAAGAPVVHLLPFDDLGDGVAAWRMIIEERGTGRQLYADEILVRFGRLLVTVLFGSGDKVFTPADERSVVRSVVERAEA